MPDIWIQLENRAWDVSPFNIDRVTGQSVAASPVPKVIVSPETGVTRTRNMWKPLAEDALILRRYTPNWAAPADRKVNPWDLNELDPTDNGTMGTIPGPVIECNLGETVTVHFRNKDARAGKTTYVSLHGLETARRLAASETALANDALRALPGDTGFLLSLAQSMLARKN